MSLVALDVTPERENAWCKIKEKKENGEERKKELYKKENRQRGDGRRYAATTQGF